MINSATKAASVARYLVGSGVYKLGTGDCDTSGGSEFDCAGFAINKCYNIRRHRPGFNVGSWASVSHDLNCNSAIEDAHHKQELFEVITRPEVGCLLTYPTFTIKGLRGLDEAPHTFIGHVGIVVGVPAEWDKEISGYGALTVVQCCGPNGHKPGIIMTNGSHWDRHDATWPRPEHKTVMLRVKQPAATCDGPRCNACNNFRITSDGENYDRLCVTCGHECGGPANVANDPAANKFRQTADEVKPHPTSDPLYRREPAQ